MGVAELGAMAVGIIDRQGAGRTWENRPEVGCNFRPYLNFDAVSNFLRGDIAVVH